MTTSAVVAVTGANGYVGSVIVAALRKEVNVISLVRSPKKAGDCTWSLDMSEGRMAEIMLREAITHVVHTAWDMQANSLEELRRTCLAGTARLLAAAKSTGVKQVIFVSTISAFDGARSAYGRSKLAAEELVAWHGGLILRLGLVFGSGNGGVLGSLRTLVAHFRVIPVFGGAGAQYLLHEESLSKVVCRAIRGDFSDEQRVITLAHPDPVSLPKLLRALAAENRRKVLLVPIPWRPVYIGLRFLELLGFRLGFRSDSVISFVYQNPKPDFTPLFDHQIETISNTALDAAASANEGQCAARNV